MPRQDLLDEIPPDPVNFLREDGGDDKQRPEPSQSQRQPNKNRTQPRNRQDRPRQEIANNDNEGSLGDSPPRARNQNTRPRPPQQQQQNRSPQEGGAPKRAVHPQQLRNERRAVPAPNDEQQGPQQHTPNRQRRQNYRPPNRDGDRNNITVEITDGDVRSVKCMRWQSRC